MHYPIGTKRNNRYRGPIESDKQNAFYMEAYKNLDYIKNVFDNLEIKTKEIDNNIKCKSYYSIEGNINRIRDFLKDVE